MTRLPVAVALIVACAWLDAQSGPPHLESIRTADMRNDLFFLASDEMRGRLPTTSENALAARWIAARFERLGLTPGDDSGSYFRPFSLTATTLGSANTLEIEGGRSASLLNDYFPLRVSGSGQASGEVVFVGFGVDAPALGYSDYRRADVKGKILLALEHDPGEHDSGSRFDGLVSSQFGTAVWKTIAAQDAGATAILFVADVHNHAATDFRTAALAAWPAVTLRPQDQLLPAAWVDRIRIPALSISPTLAESLLRTTGRSLMDHARMAESQEGIRPIALGTRLTLASAVERTAVPERNILGYVPGVDPVVGREVVVISAHFDHLGQDADRSFTGADDNGSGVVALLDIAEAYALAARDGLRPRRSVLFASWNAEERGLFGAWSYVDSPRFPLTDTVAVLNMDMIGGHEEIPSAPDPRFAGLDPQTAESNRDALNVIGSSRSPDLAAIVSQAGAGSGLTLRMRYDNNASNLMRRSDHWPFLHHRVPALWFHSGLHPDYHTVRDRPETIDYGKVERVARLVYQISWRLATQSERPRFSATGLR